MNINSNNYRFLPPFRRTDGLDTSYILEICRNLEVFLGQGKLSYLEVGAFDGVFQSNTLALHKELGWTGLLVEPVEENFRLCLSNRPNDLVLHAALCADSTKILQISPSGPTSSVQTLKKWYTKRKKVENVLAYPLKELAIKYPTISKLHFLSIDVEGFEMDVLDGSDLEAMNTAIALIEIRPHNMMPIVEKMIRHGFVLVDSLSRFNKSDNPGWDGSHQDYLFLRSDFVKYLCSLHE